MSNKPTISKLLDEYGLTNYEAKSYISLLEKKQMTASEVSRIAGVPRGRVYDTLEQLQTKGLCHSISGKTKLYSATDPSLLKDILYKSEQDRVNSKISEYQERIKKEKDSLVEKYKKVEDLVEKLAPVYQNSRDNNNPFDYLEIVIAPTQIVRKLCQLYSEAKEEIVSFSRAPYAITTKEQRKEITAYGEEAVKRGVELKYIIELPDSETQKANLIKEVLGQYEPGKEKIKIIDKLPIKMIIADAKIVMFTLVDPAKGNISVASLVAKNSMLAESLLELFELYWQKADDLEKFKGAI